MRGEGAIEIFWIIIIVLSWLISSAAKKSQTTGRNAQPWDDVRRRQPVPLPLERELEEPKKIGPFPIPEEIRDWEEEIRQLFTDMPSAPIQQKAEPKKSARDKQESRVRVQREKPAENKCDLARGEEEKWDLDVCVNPHAVVKGIIMSEILQPPRAKRPFWR